MRTSARARSSRHPAASVSPGVVVPGWFKMKLIKIIIINQLV